ncbi:hypothetical protein M2390_000596 [Mycetocola sp. BIGb0189]|uniref:hypothetical protein n=1 Tax=Mycetocola sp. BIGb0189 TaxID=2940604 RepID=UPI002168DDBF|nr:hypothetical protein [Mycetocola sp. BIGb0189]MCS4275435.1 hypothetical protein [Mycetocola sp. BIGb0189]
MSGLWEFADKYAVSILIFGGLLLGVLLGAVSIIYAIVRDRIRSIFPPKQIQFSVIPTPSEIIALSELTPIDTCAVDRVYALGWVDELERRQLETSCNAALNSSRLNLDESVKAIFLLAVSRAIRGWEISRDMRSQLSQVAGDLGVMGLWKEISENSGTRENSRVLRASLERWL